MKTQDFVKIINMIPRYTPVFVVSKVPSKYGDILEVGDEVVCIGRGEAYEHTKTKELLRIGASYLEFKEYSRIVRDSKLYSDLYGKPKVKKSKSKRPNKDSKWENAVKFFTDKRIKIDVNSDSIVVNKKFTFYPHTNEWQRNGYEKRYFSKSPEDFCTRFLY